MFHDRLVGFALLLAAGSIWLATESGAPPGQRVLGVLIAAPTLTYLSFGVRSNIQAIKQGNREAKIRREQRKKQESSRSEPGG